MKEANSTILYGIWKLVPDSIKAFYTPNAVIIIRQYSAVISVTSISSQEISYLEIRQKRYKKNSYTFHLSPAGNADGTSAPKKVFFGLQISVLPPYILLFFSSFVLLFSFYHYLTRQQKQKSDLPQHIEQELIQDSAVQNLTVSSPVIQTPFPTEKPTKSPAPSLFPTQTPLPSTTEHILKLSHTPAHNLSSVSPKIWKAREHITIVFADSCQFKSCNTFSHFANLEELYLHKNPITSIRSLSHLSRLKILVLSSCNLKSVSPLSKLKELTALDLSHNYKLKNLSAITSLKKLQYLILSNTNASKEEITLLQKKLPHCTVIY